MASTAPLKILGICGSLRKGSFNRALLRVYQESLPADATMTVFERLGELPHYDNDIDGQPAPPPVQAFRDAIAAADALVIVSPEYNYSVPGVLKNAIDWASRPPPTTPLRGKPCGILGGGGLSGTMRMQYHLRQIFVFTGTLVMVQPEVFVPKVAEKFDASLNLTDDHVRESIKKHATALVAWARKVH